ncbi:hypothetical protein [Bosea sp. LjRoot237]|uniref:hypothetical protein n=1 Tax=Bosea sp. LjRoot237 TaxID=3342292 RepID=UPI003ED07968
MPVEVKSIEVGPRCVRDFPDGSNMVADVLAAGVEIEISLAMILGMLSGSDPQAAAIVLRQMRSVADQEKAVLNVAGARLAPKAFDIAKIASQAIAGHRTRRNRFAHNPWACSAELPGAIFLIEATLLTHYLTGHSGTVQRAHESTAPFEIKDDDIYRTGEVQRAREEAKDAAAVMRLLLKFVRAHYRPDLAPMGESAEEALSELRAVGSFAKAETEFRIRAAKKRSR